MRLVRVGNPGEERPGILDSDGVIRDLSSVISDVSPDTVRLSRLAELATIDVTELPIIEGTPRFGVPVAGISKIIAVALNYADHAEEAGLPIPPEPIFFTKAITSLVGPDDDIMSPRDATKLDWEAELGVIIGRTMRYVDVDDALDHVAGYVLANDVTERAFQKERGSQWVKGKSCDTFCPTGPWFVTPDELGDPQDIDISLDVNDVRMQTGNTRTMIFSVAECLSYISRFLTLQPGDLVVTGTPPGVGEGKKPAPVWLTPGDVVSLRATRLGTQRQRVVPFTLAASTIIG